MVNSKFEYTHARVERMSATLPLSCTVLKTIYKHVKLSTKHCKTYQDSYVSARLLLVSITVSSKNCTISIIVKENITVNRQNRLITHPY